MMPVLVAILMFLSFNILTPIINFVFSLIGKSLDLYLSYIKLG